MRDKLFNDDIDIADFRFDDSVVKFLMIWLNALFLVTSQ